MKKTILAAVAALSFVLVHSTPVMAEDSAKTQMENTASDVKTDTKKGARKMKRKGRKAMGKDSMGKDINDGVKDAHDDIENKTDKMKNKANE